MQREGKEQKSHRLMHSEDAVLVDNWLLKSWQPAMNQQLMIRRLEDSGKVFESSSQQNILHMLQFDVNVFTRIGIWAATQIHASGKKAR